MSPSPSVPRRVRRRRHPRRSGARRHRIPDFPRRHPPWSTTPSPAHGAVRGSAHGGAGLGGVTTRRSRGPGGAHPTPAARDLLTFAATARTSAGEVRAVRPPARRAGVDVSGAGAWRRPRPGRPASAGRRRRRARPRWRRRRGTRGGSRPRPRWRWSSLPAVLATADRTATPSAAPTSWPVIRKPDAMPACCGGMPAIAVTDTGTNTMPTPEADDDQPGQDVGGEGGVRRWPWASRTAPPATRTRPTAAMARGVPWARACLASDGADGDGQGERHEREAGADGGVAQDGLDEDRGEEDGADEDAGDAEHHGRAGDQRLHLPGVRRDERVGGASLEADERGGQHGGDPASETSTRAESQPCCSVAPSAKISATEAADDGDGAEQVELVQRDAGRPHAGGRP